MNLSLCRCGLAAVASLLMLQPVRADSLVFQASASGKETLDQGAGGGNPFASALIEILAQRQVTLSELGSKLSQLTIQKSGGFQAPDLPVLEPTPSWSVVPIVAGERRSALVLVNSDYGKSGGAQSLPGAKYDALRVAAALKAAGFVTDVALDLDLNAIKQKLASFEAQSRDFDAAVIYTTGHGVEVDGQVFLLPGDYPIPDRGSVLASRAVPLATIAHSLHAKRINLVFYGGCRNNPWGQ